MRHELPPVDAVLLLSFGGPEGPDDVVPFLENVTRGGNMRLRSRAARSLGTRRRACRIEGRRPPALGTRGPRPFPCRPGCCAHTPQRPVPR